MKDNNSVKKKKLVLTNQECHFFWPFISDKFATVLNSFFITTAILTLDEF